MFVSFNCIYITSIQLGYFVNGALVMSAKYGGPSKGENFRVVSVDVGNSYFCMLKAREVSDKVT